MKLSLRDKVVRVEFRKMRQNDGLSEPGLITIDPRLRAKPRLEVFIHEMLHQVQPDMDETVVTDIARDFAVALWEDGYRQVKDT